MFLTVFPGGVSVARYCESYGLQAVFKVHLVDGAGKFDAPASVAHGIEEHTLAASGNDVGQYDFLNSIHGRREGNARISGLHSGQ